MKSYKIIEKLLSQLQYKNNPAEPDKFRTPIDEAWQRHETKQMALLKSHSSRRAFGARPSKWVAAAAFVLVALVVSIGILDRSTGPAYALDQTVEAVKDIRYFHFRNLNPGQNVDKEAWVEYDQDGQLKKVRVDFLRLNSVMVWNKGVTQYLKADPNELYLFEDMEYTDKILFFANGHDPRNAVKYFRKREAQGDVQIEIGEPSGRPQLIPVTVTYEPNTYMIGKPSPQMRDVLHIDPGTKLVSYINVHVKDKDLWRNAGVWEYLDYNQPFDPDIFDLEKEIGEDTTRFNTLGLDLGLEQEEMADREIAVRVAEEFLKAWKSKDYDRAVHIHGYITRANRDEVLQMLNESDLLQIVEIGEAVPAEQPMRGYCLRCTLEMQRDSTTRKSKWEIYVRRFTLKRWRIGKISPIGE